MTVFRQTWLPYCVESALLPKNAVVGPILLEKMKATWKTCVGGLGATAFPLNEKGHWTGWKKAQARQISGFFICPKSVVR